MSDEQHQIIEYDIHQLAKMTQGDKSALGDAVKSRTFQTGTYDLVCHPDYSITANMTAERNPGRPEIALKLDPVDEGMPFFLRISPVQSIVYDSDGDPVYEEDENGDPTEDYKYFSDARHKNYSRFVMALGQQGDEYDVKDLLDAMVNTTFTFKIVEYVGDIKVGDIPVQKDQDYHYSQGRGELEEVFFRIREDSEDVRNKIMSLGYDLRNYVDSIRAA